MTARGSSALVVCALAVCALALSAACVRTSYHCATDADCDTGHLGRCEATGRCTVADAACPTQRRYTEHSEALSGQCFDDSAAPANLCAGGQPPARPHGDGDACLTAVCAALPACCATGWSDACVQAAQLRCELSCDTRIAVTALIANRRELYDLRRTAAGWTATRAPAPLDAALAWLAPAPGSIEPRLAGVTASGALLVGGTEVARLDPAHAYQSITSVDLDRDGRDTIALASAFDTLPVQHQLTIAKLDDASQRAISVPRSQHLGWGDNDHDAFPDGIAGFNAVYALLDNALDPAALAPVFARTLSVTTSVNVSNEDTPPAPPIRGFDWIDLDADGRLELAIFGTQLRVHAGDVRFSNTPAVNRDCDPLIPSGLCAAPEAVSFAGAALPSLDAPALAIATFPMRRMYRVAIDPAAPQSPVITLLPDACMNCPPIIALAARDLDGDRRIDLVGLDTRLHVHTALAAEGYTFTESTPIPTAAVFTAVELSVSGAPTP